MNKKEKSNENEWKLMEIFQLGIVHKLRHTKILFFFKKNN
jgi:hypothetical protein